MKVINNIKEKGDIMEVKNEIKGELYEKFMRYAFKKCDAVMFVFSRVGYEGEELSVMEKNAQIVKDKLKKSVWKIRHGDCWVYSGSFHRYPGDAANDTEVFFYKTHKAVLDYLLSNKELYKWLSPDYPEDIAFFKNGNCWFYSVIHEELCWINCRNKKEYEELKSLGIEFYEKSFVRTPIGYIYYENYKPKELSHDNRYKRDCHEVK